MDNKEKWRDYAETKGQFDFTPFSENTLYESKKIYEFHFAFNDGKWLRYPTIKYKMTKENGDVKIKVYSINKHKDTKSLIKDVVKFGIFQRMIGVSKKEEVFYHMVDYIYHSIGELEFQCNDENKAILKRALDHVMEVDITDDMKEKYKDDRQYCLDKRYIKTHTNGEIRKAMYKGKRINAKLRLMLKYDENKSVRQNASDIGCDKGTIVRYKKWLKDKPDEVKDIKYLVKYYFKCNNT